MKTNNMLTILLFLSCVSMSCSRNKHICESISKGSKFNIDILQICNQIFIVNDNLILLYYVYADPNAYNPFMIDPFILFYNNELVLQSVERVNALQIEQVVNDTVFLYARDNKYCNSSNKSLFHYKIKYLKKPNNKMMNTSNKVIESFVFDTATLNVHVKFREYEDLYIGVANPSFFKDTNVPYTNKEMICGISNFIFNKAEHLDGISIKRVTLVYSTPHQLVYDDMCFANENNLLDFYNNVYKYITKGSIVHY